MTDLRGAGGVAALVAAAAYLCGFAVFIGLLDSSTYLGPVRKVAFLAENHVVSHIAIFVTYVMSGLALVVLAVSLNERLRGASPALMPVATAFGLIWAGLVLASGMILMVGAGAVVELFANDPERAASVWLAVNVVHDGLGGGVEVVGGLWMVLIGYAGFRSGALPKAANYLGLFVGIAGILTVVPALGILADIFGLGQILWFLLLAFIMLRNGRSGLAPPTVDKRP